MLQAVKRQLSVRKEDWLFGSFIAVIAYLAGGILLAVLMFLNKSADFYINLGSILAMAVGGIYFLLTVVGSTISYFNLEISFGSTRKEFLVSHYIACFLHGISYVAMIFVLALLEQTLARSVLTDKALVIDILPWIPKAGGLIVTGIIVLSTLAAALIMRFGRLAGWSLWGVWMVFFIGFPRVMDAAPNSVFGRIGRWFLWLAGQLPWYGWLALGGGAALLCLLGTVWILKKQQVTA